MEEVTTRGFHAYNAEDMNSRPQIAIVDGNILAVLGLKELLQRVIPIMNIQTFGSFAELKANAPDSFVHYFVETTIVLSNLKFFSERRRKTIVLSASVHANSQVLGFHNICTRQSEQGLISQLLSLEQMAHAHGHNLPPIPKSGQDTVLSEREAEVLSLVVQGKINKAIAEELHISMNTVISHRKNITEKLGIKSVSSLTIYAVMHGYVNINQLNVNY